MGFGTLEFVLIFTIMLVVLGPERMAEVARKLGHFIGYAKRMSRNFQVQLEDELELKKIRDSLPTRVDLKSELGIDKLAEDVKELSRPISPTPGATAAALTSAAGDSKDASSDKKSDADAPVVAEKDAAASDNAIAANPDPQVTPEIVPEAAQTPPISDSDTPKETAQQ